MELYTKFHPRLEKYYPLVDSLIDGNLSMDLLNEFFSPFISEEIINLSEKFFSCNFKRACGNPGFVHSLRILIWIVALGGDDDTKLLALFHDVLEDFGSSSESLENEFSKLPKSIAKDCLALTNRHSLLIKELENVSEKEDHLSSLSSSGVLSNIANETFDLFKDNSLSKLKQDSYKRYLELIKDAIYKTGNEKILMVKLADRLDNTLADWPSKFRSLVKIYSKNTLVLDMYKDIVLNGFASSETKLLYVLLIERSIDQISFLIKNYSVLVERRGLFYGNQYAKLRDLLIVEKEKLLPFESVKEELLSQDSLKKFLEQF